MSNRKSLQTVRSVYARQEQSRAEELARFNAERHSRADEEAPAARPRRAARVDRAVDADRARFERFFQRMADTVDAQEALVKRLSRAMQAPPARRVRRARSHHDE